MNPRMHVCPYSWALGICKNIGIRTYLASVAAESVGFSATFAFWRGTSRLATFFIALKGGPEPLEKDIHEILGSKREDRFSDPFFDWVQHTSLVRFSYLLRMCNFCKAPRDMRKFPQKCQKIAGC